MKLSLELQKKIYYHIFSYEFFWSAITGWAFPSKIVRDIFSPSAEQNLYLYVFYETYIFIFHICIL